MTFTDRVFFYAMIVAGVAIAVGPVQAIRNPVATSFTAIIFALVWEIVSSTMPSLPAPPKPTPDYTAIHADEADIGFRLTPAPDDHKCAECDPARKALRAAKRGEHRRSNPLAFKPMMEPMEPTKPLPASRGGPVRPDPVRLIAAALGQPIEGCSCGAESGQCIEVRERRPEPPDGGDHGYESTRKPNLALDTGEQRTHFPHH